MCNEIRLFWNEPSVTPPPHGRLRRWAPTIAVAMLGVLEIGYRADLHLRPLALVLALGLAVALGFRHRQPFVASVSATWALSGTKLALAWRGQPWTEPHASVVALVLIYALFRWAAGWQAVVGLGLILVGHISSVLARGPGLVDAVGGVTLAVFPAALAASVRFRHNAHQREIEQVQWRQREQLARELHDTVAHHISAIVIQAQAGRAVASKRPEAAYTALDVIEQAAARALDEMRDLVRTLRHDEPAALAPQPRIVDIERLAQSTGDGLAVQVQLSGDLHGLSSAVETTVYRITQEAITNAVRHARKATQVIVEVQGDADNVRLTVSDNGASPKAGTPFPTGYGLRGMRERAALLGGHCHVGPNEHGFVIRATLPRKAAQR